MTAQPKLTIYANTVQIRLTPREMVLDFVAYFPDKPNQGPPVDIPPEVRVVLPPGALEGLIGLLGTTAAAQRDRLAQKKATSQEPPKDRVQ